MKGAKGEGKTPRVAGTTEQANTQGVEGDTVEHGSEGASSQGHGWARDVM